MSKKTGFMGISLSIATLASLSASMFLLLEHNENNKVVSSNFESLTTNVEKNIQEIHELKNNNNPISSTDNTDVQIMSDRIIELENQVLAIQSEVANLPEIVQLNEDGEVAEKPVATPPVTPPVTKPDKVVQTAPTVSNPVFKTNARLNFRSDASTDASIQKTLNVGETLTWVENLQKTADGYTWIKVKDSKGNFGWVAQQYTIKTN